MWEQRSVKKRVPDYGFWLCLLVMFGAALVMTKVEIGKELKDKDIIYLYITGETSPLGTWKNMIPDIHGEHFRVTDEQWSYLREKFSIRGVPTYFVIDKEGNITYKQTGFPGVDTMKEQLMKALEK